ncbi:MAG: hypothetical protein RL481_2467 [Pseudomonadota bacterium]
MIAGGGIGGLSAALSLAAVGIKSLVLERHDVFCEVGAGIQLGPNAFHALDFMGVGQGARRRAVMIEALRLMDAMSAEHVCDIPTAEPFRARFGNPYAVVHRGELHSELVEACRSSPLVSLRTRAEIASFEQDGSRVRIALTDGEGLTGAALIGADGLHSAVRRQLIADGTPRIAGHTTYRAVIPVQQMPEAMRWNAATLWAGPRCHLVHYPLSDWKAFNLVVTSHDDAREPVAGEPVSHDVVRGAFAHIHATPGALIEAASSWKKWVLCDREPVSAWSQGHVTLLGDSAHPTLQYLAQGACMAMEDAVVLAAEMARSKGDLVAAMQRYEQRRLLRTSHVVLLSRAVGDHIYHPQGVHAQLRNQIMAAKTSEQWFDHLDWLYGTEDVHKAIAEIAAKVKHEEMAACLN